jgi:integrase/recombinase XerD
MKTYLDTKEVAVIEQAANNLRDRLLIRLLLYTGCRISEALGLTVDDIHFDTSTITIQHLKARSNLLCPECKARLSKIALFCPRCGKKVDNVTTVQREERRLRTIPVDPDTMEMAKDYIIRGGVVGKNGKKYLFGINRHRAWQIITRCASEAGLPQLINPQSGKVHHVSPHRLRDAFAVHAVKVNDSGDALRMLQEHLGHQSIATTMGYRKIAGEELKQWYQRLWEKDR